jgi:hypothetical protein
MCAIAVCGWDHFFILLVEETWRHHHRGRLDATVLKVDGRRVVLGENMGLCRLRYRTNLIVAFQPITGLTQNFCTLVECKHQILFLLLAWVLV